MKHSLPPLPFSPDALAPFLTAETFQYHHGKHHQAYVDKLNAATADDDRSLMQLVKETSGGVFDNAAQHFNHSFYWKCIDPGGAPAPSGDLAVAIDRDFGSLEKLKEAFTNEAATHFGSGWAWLVLGADGKLAVKSTHDADCPVKNGDTPLLTCDVWEHAYYVDYRNARPKYVEGFWNAANWDFAAACMANPSGIEAAILG